MSGVDSTNGEVDAVRERQALLALATSLLEADGVEAPASVVALGEWNLLLCARESMSGRQADIRFGAATLAHRAFVRGGVTSLSVEQAIEWTEDAIMFPQRHVEAPVGLLPAVSAGSALTLAGLMRPGLWTLERDALEQVFADFVAMLQRAASPWSAEAAAALVLLRELMHHWHIGQIQVHPIPTSNGV